MIRDGVKEDAGKIARLKIDNWRKTYSKIFPEDFLNNLDLTKEKEKYLNNLKNKNVIIYEKAEEPIAYCYYGENAKFKDYEGEVFALYVEKTGFKGSFERTIANIEKALNSGKKVSVNTVLIKENFEKYKELYTYLNNKFNNLTYSPTMAIPCK